MPTYVASIRDVQGKPKKERITADSLGEARAALRDRGLVVQDLKESKSGSFSMEDINMLMTSVTVKDKASVKKIPEKWRVA